MLSEFNSITLPENSLVEIHDNIMTVTKWNWDYAECLDFKQQCQDFIRENKNKKVYIFCNHPHVFTLGRGNERGAENLEDFDSTKAEELTFPLFKIKRGGGITFHHPGQWIFYPVVAINPKENLETLMCWMLKEVANTLRDSFEVKDVLAAKKLMGVWIDRKKIASIGLGVNRFVTEHGLALNLQEDLQMKVELAKIFPCGLSSKTYTSLEELNGREDNLAKFHRLFMQRLFA